MRLLTDGGSSGRIQVETPLLIKEMGDQYPDDSDRSARKGRGVVYPSGKLPDAPFTGSDRKTAKTTPGNWGKVRRPLTRLGVEPHLYPAPA
jgi:hypothetical protein